MRSIPLALALLCNLTWVGAEPMKKDFGQTADGQAVEQYVLKNRNGVEARLMTYGATWTHLLAPDREGKMGDILLGFDNLDGYLKEHPYFGSTVGRVANRIARGQFQLNGKAYKLATNNGPNHLHGGLQGWDKMVWKAESVPDAQAVKFSLTDPDGHNGYPGTVQATVMFTLTDADELRIDYTATCDQPTPINLTNHAYFNLGTAASGSILDHELHLQAERYTPVDDTLIPTGKIDRVTGTPMDFTSRKAIGQDVEQVGKDPTGYDHNYVLDPGTGVRKAAWVIDPQSGRSMEVWTDQPGVQFYSGNFLDGSLRGKGGVVYQKHQGFCLETQHFPDSINQPSFPNTVLKPGETFRSTTIYKFTRDR